MPGFIPICPTACNIYRRVVCIDYYILFCYCTFVQPLPYRINRSRSVFCMVKVRIIVFYRLCNNKCCLLVFAFTFSPFFYFHILFSYHLTIINTRLIIEIINAAVAMMLVILFFILTMAKFFDKIFHTPEGEGD